MENQEKLNKEFLELFKIIGLTSVEFKVLMKIAATKSTLPAEIAELTGVPKSKIYGIFKSLAEKGFLQHRDRTYTFKPESFSNLKNRFESIFSDFNKFLDRLIESYPIEDEMILKKIKPVLIELGYQIEFYERLTPTRDQFTHFPPEFIREFKRISPPWCIIAVSSTSGLKVGLVIISPTIQREARGSSFYYVLSDTLFSLGIDQLVVVGSDSPELSEHFGPQIIFLPMMSDYENKLRNELEKLDRRWRQTRETLDSLELEIEEPYRMITNVTAFLASLRGMIKQFGKTSHLWIYKSFEEIIDRIEGDLKADTDVYLNIKFRFKSIRTAHRENRQIPTDDQILKLKNSSNEIKQDLDRLTNETSSLYDEILAVSRNVEYKKHGYIANPFVFTIPVENHLKMVGQEKAITKMRDFISHIIDESADKNVTFIVDDPGMGKTHLMKSFVEKMNNKEISHSIGLYIRCKTGTDLISIYNQLQIAITQLPKSKLKEILLSVLNESNQPETMNELTELLRKLSQYAYDNGMKGFFLFIDEFENMIPPTSEVNTALLQLRNLIQTPHVGFIIVLRKDYWNKNERIHDIIPPNLYQSIVMEKFDETLTKSLIEIRLQMFSEPNVEKINFDDATIAVMVAKTGGNIRNILTLARDAFKKAIRKNVTTITPQMIMKEKDQLTLEEAVS